MMVLIACPYCRRHFRSRGGRTKHIRARHRDRVESGPYYEPLSAPPPIPSSHPNPNPFNHTPPPLSDYPPPSPLSDLPASLHGDVEIAALDLDADDDMDAAPGMNDPRVPDGPPITRAYHPTLDGRICDERGNNIPLDTPPPPRGSDKALDDWTPYNSRLQFELAEFLLRRCQMSAENINILTGLWAASMVKHRKGPPFWNSTHLYDTIDLTPLGDVTWKSFTLRYNGHRPVEDIPPWMEANYDVWFRDPRTLVHNLLSNPDFEYDFDYAPYQERTTDGVHRFQDFMSGNWAWNQADTIAKDPQTHGSVLCPIILGSDITTVSVATGNKEYWPVYLSIGNIHNSIRRAHRNGVVVLGFLPIPKATPGFRADADFFTFRRQLVHESLAKILKSLKPGMTTPEVVRFPDGHFRKVIYGLGPYIADYPRQAQLACIVRGWCTRCSAPTTDLDSKRGERRTQADTEQLVESLELGVLWDEYGIVGNVVPFTNDFPRADIYESLAPDILHQLIKGCFKDHLVTWVTKYIRAEYPTAEAQRILHDIDRRMALAPPFAGLRCFPHSGDFEQWTSDDSKEVMKVYLPVIQGYVPAKMVQTIRAFLEFCYIARRDVHDTSSLEALDDALQRFHRYRKVFRTSGVCDGFNLPTQHSLMHYASTIRAFGSPNGLSYFITESKHIQTVKELWKRSSGFETLKQMLLSDQRLDKLAAARVDFAERGMLRTDEANPDLDPSDDGNGEGDDEDEDGDLGAVDGPTIEAYVDLEERALRKVHPGMFLELIRQFIFDQQHSDDVPNASIPELPMFNGKIAVYSSALVTFHAPSDPSGIGGMRRERIHAVKSWRNGPSRYDTIFVNKDSSVDGMRGLAVAHVQLFFSFSHHGVEYRCVVVNWFSRVDDSPDDHTGMWVVQPDDDEIPPSIIHVDSIVRAAHLLPVFGTEHVSKTLSSIDTLGTFTRFYVNKFIDHHTFETVF